MKIEVSFEPVETDKLPGQTLADVEPMMFVECPSWGARFRDTKNNVWELLDDGGVKWQSGDPTTYTFSKILGPVRVLPPENPPELPVVRLDTLDQQVWVECYHWTTQSPWEARLCCHDGTGRVFGLDGGDVPFPIPVVAPSSYIVVGKSTGQLRIRVTDDASH